MISAPIGFVDPAYSTALRGYLGDRAPERISALGGLDMLERKSLTLFCSVKCPGNLILRTYDLARKLRDSGVVVISGFHSPMEKKYLSLLLRETQPVVWCIAIRLAIRGIAKEYSGLLADERLLILSPFGEKVTRATEKTAVYCIEVLAALAERIFVALEVHGCQTEALCRKVLKWRKPLLTFDDPENATLKELGASAFDLQDVIGALGTEIDKAELLMPRGVSRRD